MIKVADQAWRRRHKAGKNLLLNSPIEVIAKCDVKPIIIFVHTGKCAGESIIKAVRKAFSKEVTVIEYHCFDANRLIRELLTNRSGGSIPGNRELTFMVATRDPVNRWVSSFNWDLHQRFLRKSISPSGGYRKYPKVYDLAKGICNKEKFALSFGKSGHMGMGVSWYLPMDVLPSLVKHPVYVIRMEHLNDDFNLFASDFAQRVNYTFHKPPALLPKTKDNYKASYPNDTFGDLKSITNQEMEALRNFLGADYEVSRYLQNLEK